MSNGGKKMNLQVLVSTMHQTDHRLLERMNIQSDAIVINQCDHNCVETFTFRGHNILWMSMNERGVGLSRNNALMRASGDILLFADDDVVYTDDYVEKVMKTFENNPKSDLIVFNLQSQNPNRPEAIVEREYKLHWYNCLKFGAFRIAVRKDEIRKANVFYSLLFGGGAKYQSGEDNLFIVQCLKNGVKGLASSETIGIVQQEESTWFKGFDEKYFYDKGVLMKQCFGPWARILLIALLVKNSKQTKALGMEKAIICAFNGSKEV